MPHHVVIAGIYSREGLDGSTPQADDEYVVLVNLSKRPVDLRGWSLTNRKRDEKHHYRSMLPRFLSNGDAWELEPGGLVFLHTGRGTSGATATDNEAQQFHFYLHRSSPIWNEAGDVACLYDRNGHLVSWCELPGVRKRA